MASSNILREILSKNIIAEALPRNFQILPHKIFDASNGQFALAVVNFQISVSSFIGIKVIFIKYGFSSCCAFVLRTTTFNEAGSLYMVI